MIQGERGVVVETGARIKNSYRRTNNGGHGNIRIPVPVHVPCRGDRIAELVVGDACRIHKCAVLIRPAENQMRAAFMVVMAIPRSARDNISIRVEVCVGSRGNGIAHLLPITGVSDFIRSQGGKIRPAEKG